MRHLIITILFLSLGNNLFGQDFVAKLDKIDSSIINKLDRYKMAVSFLIKNKRLINTEFQKSGEMLEANSNLIDSLAKVNPKFEKIKMLFSDSLMLKNESPIHIWFEKNGITIIFYVRDNKKAVRFKKETNTLCILKYRDSRIPEKSNWWDGNEQASFTIDKNWKYVILTR